MRSRTHASAPPGKRYAHFVPLGCLPSRRKAHQLCTLGLARRYDARPPPRALQGGERGSDSLDCMQGLGQGLVRNGLLSLREAALVCEAGGLRGDTGFPAACKRGAVLEFLQGANELSFNGTAADGEGVRRIIRSLAMDVRGALPIQQGDPRDPRQK